MNYSTPGFPVLYHLPEFAQIHISWVNDAIQPSHSLPPSSPFAFNLSQHESFPMSQLFTSGGQSIRASASVLPMNVQGWFPLGLTGLISLQSRGLSGVFSGTTVQKHQFFSAPPSFTETVPTAFAEFGCELRVRVAEHLHLYRCPPIPASDFTAPLDNYVIAALHRPLYGPC